VSHDTEDDLISSLIVAARRVAEASLKRALVTQTIDITVDDWCELMVGRHPDGRLYLPRPSLQSVQSITYIDSEGDEQTWAADGYIVSPGSPGRIVPASGLTYPSLGAYPDAVTIRAVVGYGEATEVPATIKAAMKMMLAHWYENREAVAMGSTSEMPFAVDVLLAAEMWGFCP
jgi:uncharacterized phiE125 gp8 family phage protein